MTPPGWKSRPGVVLAMLVLVYTFNFLDRQILSILSEPVKADLGLTDTQMGALGGLAFALLYSTMAIPVSLIADRTSRSGVISASLAIWSAFTALCGLATSYWQLFLFRLGVGIGEAGGAAPSYALISEYFPPGRRARAIAVYSLGVPLGSAAGALFGAQIAQAVDWRMAFFVLGVLGLIIVVPFRLLVREPPKPEGDPPPAMAVFGKLARMPVFWLLALGASAGSICGYGLGFWIPALLQRSFGLDLVETGQFFGAQFLLTGMIGVFAGGAIADRLGHANRAAYARLPAMAYLLIIPFAAAAFLSSTPAMAFMLLLIPMGLTNLWIGPVLGAVQHLVDARERATASACFLLFNNGIGMGLGSLLIGRLSDQLTPAYGADALRHAMAWSLASYVLAAVLMLLAAPRLKAAWRE